MAISASSNSYTQAIRAELLRRELQNKTNEELAALLEEVVTIERTPFDRVSRLTGKTPRQDAIDKVLVDHGLETVVIDAPGKDEPAEETKGK